MSVRFGVLGPLVVENEAGPIALGGPKQRAVLVMLLINANRPISPEQLIDSLWGDQPPPTATATLQAYISNLRRALEPERPAGSPPKLLVKNAGGYQLTTAAETIDAHRFELDVVAAGALLTTEPARARQLLGAALDLWRGPPLADFRYESFAASEIQRLEQLHIEAIESRITADLAMGRAETLVAELEALVAEHPLRERLWRHLMLALYRAGRQGEALRAYRLCETILGDELGIVPGPELRELELAILNHEPSLRLPASTDESPAVEPAGTTIVGRQRERALFRSAVARALAGHGSVLLIEGEPGIGKTRLLEVFESDARDAGLRTSFARCVEVGGTPPYWPWTQLLRKLDVDTAVAGIPAAQHPDPLVPAGPRPPATPGPPLHQVAESMAVTLVGLGAVQPVVLVIDDLYSADPDSLSLLCLVAAELRDLPVIIVGSHRGQDLGPAHPLTEALAQLVRLEWVQRVALARFTAPEVDELVTAVLGIEVDKAVVDAINDRTEGNAFFTVELARLLQTEMALHPDHAASAVPATLLEVLGRRLGQLSDAALRLARVGAVCGREFDLAIGAEALDLDLETSIAAAEEVVQAGLMAEVGATGAYRFSHVIVVDCIMRAMGSVRRAFVHDQIADALERRFAADPTRWGVIAHHRHQAVPVTGAQPAVSALARAADGAVVSNALELAEELIERRRALVVSEPASPGRDQLEITALLDLARVVTWRQGYHAPRLRDLTDRLWQLIGAQDDSVSFDRGAPITPADPVLSTYQILFSYTIVSGDVAASHDVARQMMALSELHPDPMVTLTACVASLISSLHLGLLDEAQAAREQGEAALAALDPTGSNAVTLALSQQDAAMTLRAFSAWAHWMAGDRERALVDVRAAREFCDRAGHGFNRAFCIVTEAMLAAMDGRPEWVAEVVARAPETDDEPLFGLMGEWAHLHSAWADGRIHGEPAAAADQIRQSIDRLSAEGALVMQTMYWSLVADLELIAERPDRALEATSRGLTRAEAGERFWQSELHRLEAEALGALGRFAERRDALDRAERVADRLGIVPLRKRLPLAEASAR